MTGGSERLPFDLDLVRDPIWPEHLKPIGWGERFDIEPFPQWWKRVAGELGHLPPELCEQWIHRHWGSSPYSFLPLDTLTWRRVVLSGDDVLARAHRAWGGGLDAAFDYEAFQRRGGDDRHPTARALDRGTWDFPLVLLETPFGIRNEGHLSPNVRSVIVEGHQRHRYLAALHALGRAPSGPHVVITLASPLLRDDSR